MSRTDIDEDSPRADSLVALGQTLEQLAPIRRQRLSLAEQAWRRQNTVLAALEQRLAGMQQAIRQSREAHRGSREHQHREHSDRALPLSEMNDWLAREQQAIRSIERQEKAFDSLQHEYRQQRLWAEESRQELRRRQRELEKLDYLQGLAQEAS